MAGILPLRHSKAVFMSNMGRNYSGNVRAIFEAMLLDPRFKGVKKIWAFNGDFFGAVKKNGKNMLPKDCRIVRYGGLKYYFHMATSGLWIFDTRQEPYLIKRKGNVYFQTWHGTPLKKLGLDIENLNMAGENRSVKEYRYAFRLESAKWDYLLVQNDFSEEVLPKCFGFKKEVIKAGYPRNDRLVNLMYNRVRTADFQVSTDENLAKSANRWAGLVKKIEKGNVAAEPNVQAGADGKNAKKKVLLYAPTWRDDEYLGNGFYRCPKRPDFLKLEQELSDEYRIVVKLHYLVRLQKGDIPESCIRNGFVKVVGNEKDIAELYMRADGLITDYSSVFFDFSVTEKPMFFFCYDLEEYRDELRGFYLDFEKVAPGPISTDEAELSRDIRKVFGPDKEKWHEKIVDFKKWFNSYDDGRASERVLDILSEHL